MGGQKTTLALAHMPTMCEGEELLYEGRCGCFLRLVGLGRGRGVFARLYRRKCRGHTHCNFILRGYVGVSQIQKLHICPSFKKAKVGGAVDI